MSERVPLGAAAGYELYDLRVEVVGPPGHAHVFTYAYESFTLAAPLVGLLGIVLMCFLLGWLFAQPSTTAEK